MEINLIRCAQRAEWARYPYDFEGADTLDKTGASVIVLATGEASP